ncbi:DUF4190 domain-containing protein [Streptomyces sp. Tu 2975]|uniref:hypothetical protein n=1 Tax=Streptomyces sp. Tu 2975 TaxID=2676871 RepID=UPI001358966B|nr:hypothetical protein [Streptomyces sp. Tu 2975]QIP84524.1 DUF4190 domain-containing protein [Streptomyces sp. Tu 2975]
MQLAELVRPRHRGDDRRASAAVGTEETPEAPTAVNGPADDPVKERRKDADGMAVAAFVLGLVGLLVMNIVLGPTAVVLAALALRRGTVRRGRALLGLALGIADLVVLAVLVTVNGTVVWGFGG